MPDTVIAYIPHDDQPNIIISVGAKRRGGLYCRNLTDVNTRRCACVCLCVVSVCVSAAISDMVARNILLHGALLRWWRHFCVVLYFPFRDIRWLTFWCCIFSRPFAGCQLAYQHARQRQSSEISCGLCSRTQLLNSVKSGVGRLQQIRNVQDVPHQATVKLPSPERNVWVETLQQACLYELSKTGTVLSVLWHGKCTKNDV